MSEAFCFLTHVQKQNHGCFNIRPASDTTLTPEETPTALPNALADLREK